MKLTVYTLATDCDNGTNSDVFTDKTARDDALLTWAGTSREEWQESDLADDLHEFVQTKKDYMDTFQTDDKKLDIDLAAHVTVNEAWRTCKDKPGSFGNLYDPDELFTIMDGWSEKGDETEASKWFDPESSEDHDALLAWCEEEGPDFEEQISNLVCQNLPNRKQAYDALEEKHRKQREAEKAA